MEALQNKERRAWLFAVLSLLLVGVLIAVPFITGLNGQGAQASMGGSKPSASATPSPTPEQCSATWVMKDLPSKNQRLFYDGIAEIRDATTNEQAAAAAYVVIDKFKYDPDYLVALTKVSLQKDVNRASLVDATGCATPAAAQLVLQIGAVFSMSKISPDQAPTTGTNSGVNTSGVVVSAELPGIGGDRKAIKIVLPNGQIIWIMARCGNMVTPGHPFPHGPTDQCKWNPKLPPDSPKCLQSKDPSQDPAAKGNAPIGGGKNADPGPGTYTPPNKVTHPPSTPRVNPAPPAPVVPQPQPSTPSNPHPAPVPTKDPEPAPTPEPSAPPPTNPVGGCVPLPGQKTC